MEQVLFGVVLLVVVGVIVRHLFARRNGLHRMHPDPAATDLRLAVRIAREVDEDRLIAPDRPIDALPLIQNEQEGVMPARLLLHFRAPVGLGVRDFLSSVLDDPRSLRDVLNREGAHTLNRRAAELEPFVDRAELWRRQLMVPGFGRTMLLALDGGLSCSL